MYLEVASTAATSCAWYITLSTGRTIRVSDISVGIQYLASWLRGTGAVAINNLMEDAATAEISRSQVWQWLHNEVVLEDTGERVTKDLVERLASLAPTGFLAGTPLLAGYLRLLGARVGRNVHLGTDDIGAPDLISIGDDATIEIGKRITR